MYGVPYSTGYHNNSSSSAETSRTKEYRGPPMHESMIKARDEMSRGYFGAAITVLKASLEEHSKGKGTPLTGRQQERMYMLLCECRHSNKNYEQALDDAEEAIKASNSRTPQPYFLKGKCLLALLRVPESLEAFEMAEVLMTSPPPIVTDVSEGEGRRQEGSITTSSGESPTAATAGRKSKDLSPEQIAKRDAWAQVGIDPDKAPDIGGEVPESPEIQGGSSAGPKEVQVTYDWSQDLEHWRKCYTEAKALGGMLQTHTIPKNVLKIGSAVLRKKVDEVSRRSIVLLVQNNTADELRLKFSYFFDGCFMQNHSFPNSIKPGEVGIAAVHNNGWKGTVKGVVGFSFRDSSDDGVLCCFESPLMSNFRSDVMCCSLKGLDFNKSGSTGRQVMHQRSATSSISSGKKVYKAIAEPQPSAIQKFTITTVKKAQLRPIDLVGVLEFVPSFHLKKCTIVNRLFRNVLNSFPPQSFVDSTNPRMQYPDYCCNTDFDQNPYSIPDEKVTWRIQRDTSAPYSHDEFAVLDGNATRVFSIVTDLNSRTLSMTFHFQVRKSHCMKLEENWLPMSKSSELKIHGRNVGKLEMKDSTLKLVMEGFLGGSAVGHQLMMLEEERNNTSSASTTPKGSSPTVPYGINSPGASSNASSTSGGGSGKSSGNGSIPPSQNQMLYSVRHNGTSKEKPTECHVRLEDAGPALATIYLLPESPTRRSAPVVEIEMLKGADALLCVIVAFYCRVRFAGSIATF